MTKQQKIALYHACRVAFVAGQEGKPWHMVLHALREVKEVWGEFAANLRETQL